LAERRVFAVFHDGTAFAQARALTCIELLALLAALLCMALGAVLGLKLGLAGAILGAALGAVGGFYCALALIIGLARIVVYFEEVPDSSSNDKKGG